MARYGWGVWHPDMVLLAHHVDNLPEKLREIADNDPAPSFTDGAIDEIAYLAGNRKTSWTRTYYPAPAELRAAADAIEAVTIRRVTVKLMS